MRLPLLASLLGLSATLLYCSPQAAWAQSRSPLPDEGFWAEVADPALADYRRSLDLAKSLMEGALNGRSERKRALLAAAVRELLTAARLRPSAWEPHYWAGVALFDSEGPRDAVYEFDQARLRGGEEYAEDIAFKLGVLLSKLGEMDRAVREYDRSLPYAIEDQSRAIIESNAAESLMALGRLTESIRRYRRSAELDPQNSLTYWGLGVALDRDNQPAQARDAIQKALRLDPSMRQLGADGVFFVPDGDKHYYHAFGLEVAGRRDAAIAQWQQFVRVLPSSPWVARARAHIEELGRLPVDPVPKRTLELEWIRIEGSNRKQLLDARARRLFAHQKAAVMACLEPIATLHNTQALIRLSVGRSGEVIESFVSANTMLWRRGCVESLVRHWRFPALKRESNIAFSLKVRGTEWQKRDRRGPP